jgi:hypothetical protein
MLNRGEAPAAQLFAISEEAEIRYTTGGLLYEVPAAERSDASEVMAARREPSGMSRELISQYQACAAVQLLCLQESGCR